MYEHASSVSSAKWAESSAHYKSDFKRHLYTIIAEVLYLIKVVLHLIALAASEGLTAGFMGFLDSKNAYSKLRLVWQSHEAQPLD
ncbi:hypothetical protein EV1_035840 [Malus domestica]